MFPCLYIHFFFILYSELYLDLQICDIMRCVLANGLLYIFHCFPKHNSLFHEFWSGNRYNYGQYSSEMISRVLRTTTKFQDRFKFST